MTAIGPKLLGAASYRSFRCLWMLEELGIPYEYEVRNKEYVPSRNAMTRVLLADININLKLSGRSPTNEKCIEIQSPWKDSSSRRERWVFNLRKFGNHDISGR